MMITIHTNNIKTNINNNRNQINVDANNNTNTRFVILIINNQIIITSRQTIINLNNNR